MYFIKTNIVFHRVIAVALFTVLSVNIAVAQEQKAVPVKVTRALSMPIYEELPLTGSVITKRLSRISPREEGLVSHMYADQGDSVKQGDLLLVLDNELAGIDNDRIAAEVKEARAGLREAIRLRDNAAELLQKKHIPATDYEARLAEVEMREAILERLQQEHTRQRSIVKRHEIFAPFDGVITEKFVEEGEWVSTDTALFQLTEIKVLRISVPVPQHFFSRIQVGTSAIVKFDAYSGQSFQTQVEKKVPMGSDNTRTFPVMIELDNSQGLFAPGMSARVTFRLETDDSQAAILLPNDAIIRKPDGSESIWLVDNKGDNAKARQVQVQTGRRYKQKIEITSGKLQPGDLVVIRGNERLMPDQSVSVIEEVEYKVN